MLEISKIWLYISQVMKTLVIHPEDKTTEFLTAIYANLSNKTVIKGGVSKSELRVMAEEHDRILMLGHGSPDGLLSRCQVPTGGLFIVDESMVSVLKNKLNCIFIWCYADQFVRRHGLAGLCTGMFISEMGEADYWGFKGINHSMIDESNQRFASIVSKYLDEPLDFLYNKLLIEYEILAKTNPIARFNLGRIYLSFSGTTEKSYKLIANNI